MLKIIIIPVKRNSLGLPHKNRILINRCLNECKKTKYPVYVIGDDEELFNTLDVNTILLPPIDTYTDIVNTLRLWKSKVNYNGFIALVQCTSPKLKAEWIDKCFDLADKDITIATACEINFKPTALFSLENGIYVPFAKDRESTNVARLLLPHTIRVTGAVEVFHTNKLKQPTFWDKVKPLIVDEADSIDIDTKEDLKLIENLIKK